ncbi:MAG: T9SS type A sorting domain-containing protein [Prevotellaceae bacterium]|jgi:hypothetical protein|nr:T9SS type A sorting domain-containing protein [Prevotellaceae bacterium]
MKRLLVLSVISLLLQAAPIRQAHAASSLSAIEVLQPPPICNDGVSAVDLSALISNIPVGTSVVWREGNTILANTLVKPATTTTYTVTFTLGSDTRLENVTLKVSEKPIIQSDKTKTICQGESIVLNATGQRNVTEVTWYNVSKVDLYKNGTKVTVDQANTVFIVMGTNEVCKGYPAKDTMRVTRVTKPTVTIAPPNFDNRTICKGDVVNLTALATAFTASPTETVITTQSITWDGVDTPAAVHPETNTSYTALMNATAYYDTKTVCGIVEATPMVNVPRNITIYVDPNCHPSLSLSTTSPCVGTRYYVYINKNGLNFTQANITRLPAGMKFESDNGARITYSDVQLVPGSKSYTANVAYTIGGTALVEATATLTATADDNCTISQSLYPSTACEGKEFTVTLSGDKGGKGKYAIQSLSAKSATNNELTALTTAVSSATKNADGSVWTVKLNPSAGTAYTIGVTYLRGETVIPKTQEVVITPDATNGPDCLPTLNSNFPPAICKGYGAQLYIDAKDYSIHPTTNVTWSNDCGSANPVYDKTAGNNISYNLTPSFTGSCTFTAAITYKAGAQTRTSTQGIYITSKNCEPELVLDPCPAGSDCTFDLSGIGKSNTSGGNGSLQQEYTFCQGQEALFYIPRKKGNNVVQQVSWTPDSVACVDSTGSLWSYMGKPERTTLYEAKIIYKDSITGKSDTSLQRHRVTIEACPVPVQPDPDKWSEVNSSICRGNEMKYTIDSIYKNNHIVNTECHEGSQDGPLIPREPGLTNGKIVYRFTPAAATTAYYFALTYNNTIKDTTVWVEYTIRTTLCSPLLTQQNNPCEGDDITIRLAKNNVITDGATVKWKSGNSFTPALSFNDLNSAQFKVTATDRANPLTATFYYLNGDSSTISVEVSGRRCPPYFSVSKSNACPREPIAIWVNKDVSASKYRIDTVEWLPTSRKPWLVSATQYGDSIMGDYGYYGKIKYSYGAENREATDTISVTMKVLRRVWEVTDTVICRGDSINLRSLMISEIEPTAIVTRAVVAPYFIDSFNAIARVATCINPNAFETIDNEYIKINVDSAIWVIAMEDTILCKGDTISLKANGLGNFWWYEAGKPSKQYKNSRPPVDPIVTTSYVVTAKNACGPIYDTVNINLKYLPQPPYAIYGSRTPLFKNYYAYYTEFDPNVLSVTWQYPEDWIVDKGDNDSILFKVGKKSGQLLAISHNECGSSTRSEYISVQRAFSVLVYPNPTSGWVNLQAKNCQMRRIAVFNMRGTQMLPEVTYSNGQNAARINLSGLHPDAYYLIIWIEEQDTPLLYKIVKTKDD